MTMQTQTKSAGSNQIGDQIQTHGQSISPDSFKTRNTTNTVGQHPHPQP
jgi:hypothetical protein